MSKKMIENKLPFWVAVVSLAVLILNNTTDVFMLWNVGLGGLDLNFIAIISLLASFYWLRSKKW